MRSSMGLLALVAGCGFSGHGDVVDAPPVVLEVFDGPSIEIDAPDAPRAMAGAQYKPITIHGSQVAGTLADFPVLVDLDDPQLAAAEATDMSFTNAANAPLSYELVSFVKPHLVAWVNVSLAAGVDTEIRLHYGNGPTTNAPNAGATWASYEAAWHLDGDTDATGHGHAAMAVGNPSTVSGRTGNALHFDGSTSYLRVADATALDTAATTGTLSMWLAWDVPLTGRYQRLLITSNRFAGDHLGFEWSTQDDGDLFFYPTGSEHGAASDNVYNLATVPFSDAAWHHIALTLDYAAHVVAMYIDGNPVTFADTFIDMTSWDNAGNPGDWYWAGTGAGGANSGFAGKLDEIRVANSVRNAAWITTEVRNQRDPSMFYAVGPAVPE